MEMRFDRLDVVPCIIKCQYDRQIDNLYSLCPTTIACAEDHCAVQYSTSVVETSYLMPTVGIELEYPKCQNCSKSKKKVSTKSALPDLDMSVTVLLRITVCFTVPNII